MSKNLLVAFIVVIVILSASGVFALGVTPGRTTLVYEPGVEKTFSFLVVNSEGSNLSLSLVVDGDLSRYVTLFESEFMMSSEEKTRKIDFNFSTPFNLAPGIHQAKIFILEKGIAGTGGTTVGAVVGVVTEIRIFVP